MAYFLHRGFVLCSLSCLSVCLACTVITLQLLAIRYVENLAAAACDGEW